MRVLRHRRLLPQSRLAVGFRLELFLQPLVHPCPSSTSIVRSKSRRERDASVSKFIRIPFVQGVRLLGEEPLMPHYTSFMVLVSNCAHKRFVGKIILEFPNKHASMNGGQSSGVRSSSFTAMNAGVSSEAIISAMAVIYF